jgi:hypothetical protein
MRDQLRPPRHTATTGLEEAFGYLVDIISRNAKYNRVDDRIQTVIGIDADITVTELGFVHIVVSPDSLP